MTRHEWQIPRGGKAEGRTLFRRNIHLACAESAGCDWFFTVDRGILKKVHELGTMRVANPVEFVLEGMK